jgi:hypothetical protein
MTDLRIGRLSASIHPMPGVDDAGDAGRRVDAMLRHLAERRLDAGLGRLGLSEGDWCIRRADVTFALDPDDGESTAESKWAATMLDSLQRILAGSQSEVVHYRRRGQALEDLVTSVAAGRIERAWAWRLVGAVNDSDPLLDADPADAMLAALERAPQYALPAILAAIRSTGLAPLHRLLESDGWIRLATLVAGAVGVNNSRTVGLLSVDTAVRSVEPGRDDAAIETRASRVVVESALGVELAGSGLRPSRTVAAAWAMLVLAEADPAALRRATAGKEIAAIARTFERQDSRSALGLVSPSPPKRQPNESTPHIEAIPATTEVGRVPIKDQAAVDHRSAGRNGTADRHAPRSLDRARVISSETPRSDPEKVTVAQPAVPEAAVPQAGATDANNPTGVLTIWGGLLFLLATAETAGIPDRLIEDPLLGTRSLRWVMHQLALRLVPVRSRDAAALALAGLPPQADPPIGAGPSDEEDRALTEWAAHWTDVTVERLAHADANPAEVVSHLSRRRGEVIGERGWIELHLDLDDVDFDVRMAGLDLDPGWIPWLGVVVRFIYG